MSAIDSARNKPVINEKISCENLKTFENGKGKYLLRVVKENEELVLKAEKRLSLVTLWHRLIDTKSFKLRNIIEEVVRPLSKKGVLHEDDLTWLREKVKIFNSNQSKKRWFREDEIGAIARNASKKHVRFAEEVSVREFSKEDVPKEIGTATSFTEKTKFDPKPRPVPRSLRGAEDEETPGETKKYPRFSSSTTMPSDILSIFAQMIDEDAQMIDEESNKARTQYLEKSPTGSFHYSTTSRRVPPLATTDTIVGGKSAHGTTTMFEDKEIISSEKIDTIFCLVPDDDGHGEKIAEVNPKELLSAEHRVLAEGLRLPNGNIRFVIQQQATRGCMAATAAMLIADRKGASVLPKLLGDLGGANLWNDEEQKQMFSRSGFAVVKTKIDSTTNFFPQLDDALRKNGSAILSIDDPKGGGHVIIVDEVDFTQKQVLIREPYHGMAVRVTFDAILKRHPNKIVQVSSEVTV